MTELVGIEGIEFGYNTWKPITKILRKENYAKSIMRCGVCKTEKPHLNIMERLVCNCQKESSIVICEEMSDLLNEGNTCKPYDDPSEHYAQTWIVTCSCGKENWRRYYTPKYTKCSACKRLLFTSSEATKRKNYVGQVVGIHTVLSYEDGMYSVVCPSGTIKKSEYISKYNKVVECHCDKCDPNHGWTHKKYSNTWKKIKDTDNLFWKTYYEFEKWIDDNLQKPADKSHLKLIDFQKPYQPDNVWWAGNDSAFHIDKWLDVIPKQDNIKLLGEDGRYLVFKCTRDHEFKRLKGRISVRSNKEGYTIQCEHCKLEDTEARKNKPKKYIPTPKETISKSIPSVTLLSDNRTWTDGIGLFECSECRSCFEMEMSVFRSKKVCPICKSEQWARFCDSEIEKKFGGKIVRTGVWTRCDVQTTWKCLKHGTHFTKTYDKVKASLSGGCPECINFSVPDPNAPTTMYYVRLKYDNTYFYKIGITQRTVYTRFDKEIAKKNLHVVKEWVYPTWREAYETEQKIIKSFRGELLCRGERPLKRTESTEIFYHDVLELDNAKNH